MGFKLMYFVCINTNSDFIQNQPDVMEKRLIPSNTHISHIPHQMFQSSDKNQLRSLQEIKGKINIVQKMRADYSAGLHSSQASVLSVDDALKEEMHSPGRGGSRIIERGGAYYKKVVFGALIKYHFGSRRNDASLCAHKLIQV